MDEAEVRDKVGAYRTILAGSYTAAQYPSKQMAPSAEDMAGHLLWLFGEIDGLLDSGQLDAAVRRLDFAQGVLWAAGGFSLNGMRAYGAI